MHSITELHFIECKLDMSRFISLKYKLSLLRNEISEIRVLENHIK